jgi:signal transduction histidine kinase
MTDPETGEARGTHADGRQALLPLIIHELRTPLTALRGALGLLAAAGEDAPPEVKSLAELADRNASKLAAIIDDLAEYERLAGGRAELRIEECDVPSLVERACSDVRALAQAAGVALDVGSASGELRAATLRTDAALVRDAVRRIVAYAVRVSPAGTTVRVTVSAADDRWRISVSDHGKAIAGGIDGGWIFEPFSPLARRAGNPAVRPGLDLAIARRIAELVGATLLFAPAPDGGVFTMVMS